MRKTEDKILVNDWHIVARTQDLDTGSIKQVKLLGEDIVIWRANTPEGQVFAWQDWCPHRGINLSLGKVVNDRLTCLYHGWQYDRTGRCVNIPSLPDKSSRGKVCVKTYQCLECWDYIWVSLGDQDRDLWSFPPEFENPKYRKLFLGPYHFQTSAFRLVENAFDLSHVPFLHAGSLGDPTYPLIENYEVELKEDSVTIYNLSAWQLHPSYNDTSTGGSTVTFPFIKIYRPLSVHAFKKTDNSYDALHWIMNVTPVEEEECLVWFTYAMNCGQEVPTSEMSELIDNIIREDALILESHRPARLPLLPADKHSSENQWPVEVHAPCDRAAITYRRWLKQLGITYGVC